MVLQNRGRMRESAIQTACIKHAKKAMPKVVILRTYTEGYPDRQFLWRGHTFFVEFKATGKKPRPEQIEAARDLYEQGFQTYYIDNLQDFQTIIQVIVNGSLNLSLRRELEKVPQFRPDMMSDEKFDL